MIEVTDLRKAFGSNQAVDGVSFSIKQGETFGLLGPNGAGKTTTLSMLVGILQADSGSVSVNGGDPTVASTRLSIGIAPQSLSLYEELSAQENLQFFGRMYGLAGTELKERVDWALEFASLTDRRKHLVKTFSGGMKRRLNMASAIIHDPQAILFDEPTVGVDPQSRNHIFDRIEELKANKRTIIYTTHYMEEAQRLCDRVAIMDAGKILASDSVSGLIRSYGGDAVIEGELTPAELTAAESGETKLNRDLLPADIERGRFRYASGDPVQEIVRLSQSGLEFATLAIGQPDLESVFLNLTGRSLRD